MESATILIARNVAGEEDQAMTNVTDKQIATLAYGIMNAVKDESAGRVTYLQALVTATQGELAYKQGCEGPIQIAALKRVHERFYAIVLSAAGHVVAKAHPSRAQEMQRQSNFARTALSALRGHVRAEGDLCALQAGKVTKASLRTRAGPLVVTTKRLHMVATRDSKRLLASLLALGGADKAAAIEEIQFVSGQLAQQLVLIGVVSTKSAAIATAKGSPLRIGKTLFMPTASHDGAQA